VSEDKSSHITTSPSSDLSIFSSLSLCTVANTRGHDYKLDKPYRSSNVRKKLFTDRVINVWNSLPSTVNFTSLMAFRRSINNVDFGSHIHCRLE